MVYLKSVENVIPLSKLIGPCFNSVSPILFLKTKRNDLACPIMGTIFLVYRISSNSFRGIYSFQVLPAAATKRGRLLNEGGYY